MSTFKPSQFNIKPGPDQSKDVKVVSVQTGGKKPVISEFSFQSIQSAEPKDYANLKSKYGSFALTDGDRTAFARKDAAFKLNTVSRGSLAIEEEEKRAIEERVKYRVAEITEEVRQTAGKQGYEEGFRQGHKDAFDEFMREGQLRLAKLESMIQEFDGARDEIYRANEEYFFELIYRIGKMLAIKEIKTDREYLQRLAKELIDRTGVRENIHVRIHPDDASTIGLLKEGLDKALGGLRNLNIEVSAEVRGGGCVVETEWSEIDGSLEVQLERLYQAIQGKAE